MPKAHTTIAHVGAHVPMTPDDVERLLLMLEVEPRTILAERDVINLGYGRDFLREDKRYDFVLLHSIFHTNSTYLHVAREHGTFVKGLLVSPDHSEAKWGERLVATGAKTIVIYAGKPFCLEGWHVGQLPGYKIERRDGVVTIYRKTRTRKKA